MTDWSLDTFWPAAHQPARTPAWTAAPLARPDGETGLWEGDEAHVATVPPLTPEQRELYGAGDEHAVNAAYASTPVVRLVAGAAYLLTGPVLVPAGGRLYLNDAIIDLAQVIVGEGALIVDAIPPPPPVPPVLAAPLLLTYQSVTNPPVAVATGNQSLINVNVDRPYPVTIPLGRVLLFARMAGFTTATSAPTTNNVSFAAGWAPTSGLPGTGAATTVGTWSPPAGSSVGFGISGWTPGSAGNWTQANAWFSAFVNIGITLGGLTAFSVSRADLAVFVIPPAGVIPP